MANDTQDKLRIRIAWVVTTIWIACFPVVAIYPTFPITWAQAPMMLVLGWLFAAPLIRRNDSNNSNNGG